MRIEFHGRNVEITNRFRDHVEPRLQTLEKHFDKVHSAKVVLSAQRHLKTVEVTVNGDGVLLRAEEQADDELTAFDRVLDALERQVEKFKGRLLDRRRRAAEEMAQQSALAEAEEQEEQGPEIVRVKYVTLKPMTPEEAILQMELLGHDFFMFLDADTEQVGVVYRRKKGGYGLILPEE